MKVFLIGMPGAGKSTLGKQLAEKLVLPFIDLDKQIETQEKTTISELFRERGEEYFREVEAKQLREASTRQHSFIMATGGGSPCFHQSLDFMKEQGIVIFMDVQTEAIHERVKKSSHRPLLSLESDQVLKQRLEKLREKRISFYEQAHLRFSGDDLQADSVARAIILFRKEGQG
jgi:shikimate kinase